MKPEGVPFFGVFVAIVLATVWWWRTYDSVTFDEKLQFNQPQVEKDGTRFGRRTARVRASDLEPNQLVRYRTKRSGSIVTGRIMAVEGQRVRIEEGQVFVDDEKVPDPYRKRTNAKDFYPELIVPAGCVFVLTDVRSGRDADRYDSRNLGPVPLEAIMHSFSPNEPRQASRGLR